MTNPTPTIVRIPYNGGVRIVQCKYPPRNSPIAGEIASREAELRSARSAEWLAQQQILKFQAKLDALEAQSVELARATARAEARLDELHDAETRILEAEAQ